MKSLIVTGGASGLGRSIAQCASLAGYRVGVLDVDSDALEECASLIQGAIPLVASVTSVDEVSAAVVEFGQIPDIWVNNAGADILTGKGASADVDEKLEQLITRACQ